MPMTTTRKRKRRISLTPRHYKRRNLGVTIPRYNPLLRYAPTTEVKFKDTSFNHVLSDDKKLDGVVSFLNIPVGNGESERNGRKITLRHIDVRGAFIESAMMTARLIIYLDKQNNGESTLIQTSYRVLQGITDTAQFNAFAHPELTEQSRFKILYDKSFNTDVNVPSQSFRLIKPLNIPVEYEGALGTPASIRSNNIGMLMMFTVPTDNSFDNPRFYGVTRIRYTDT